MQKKIIRLFNYSLNPGGIMVLGSAETLGTNNEGFDVIDDKLKIFKRSSLAKTKVPLDFPSAFSINNKIKPKILATPINEENIQSLTDQILLNHFTPASVLVGEKGDIINITGLTGKYLEPIAGKANWNLFAMLRGDLRVELPIAFQKALKNYQPVILRKIKIENYGNEQYVDVTIQQIEKPNTLKGKVMIVFNDLPEITITKTVNSKQNKPSLTNREKELEIELHQCVETLKTLREEMQSSDEELKTTNEELQSTNEELQSTNEELTTSKEEMQSLNEELQTVNIELQNKVADYVQANNDMKNLLNSTEIATLFLDKELNIRRFTDTITNIYKVRNTDIGRPITDLVTDLQYPEIIIDSKQVIKTLNFIEKSISTKDGRWFDVKIMPYRTLDDHIEGLVLTFNDVTKFKQVELELKEANEKLQKSDETRYRHLFKTAKEGILVIDADTGKVIDVNPYLVELLGESKKQFIEKEIWSIGVFKKLIPSIDAFKKMVQEEFIHYDDLEIITANKKTIVLELIGDTYIADDKKTIQFLFRHSENKD